LYLAGNNESPKTLQCATETILINSFRDTCNFFLSFFLSLNSLNAMTMKEDSIQDKEFADIDLAAALSSTRLSDKKTADLGADKLLDELSLPQHEQSLYMNETSASASRNTYDQFFEEVSLDLPRDDTHHHHHQISRSESQSPSRLIKFMPRRGNSLPGSTVNLNTNNKSTNQKMNGHHNKPTDSNMTITTSDISGPFYSISDVLDDTASPTTAAAAMAAARGSGDFESVDMNPRAARRNVNEAEVIVTSGGTSIQVKRRTS
jgi:hypothetical protein